MNVCVEDYLSDLLDAPPTRPRPSPKAANVQAVAAIEAVDVAGSPGSIEAAAPSGATGAVVEIEALDAVAVAGSIQASDPIEPAVAVAHVQPDPAIARTTPVPAGASPALAPAIPSPSNPPPMHAMPLPVAAAPAQSAAVALLHRLASQDASGQAGRRAAERATRWLRMRCDEQHYAVELLKIQEVVLPATLLPLRGAAAHMLGVMNLRGQIVPVIDLGLYLGRAAIIANTSTRIVVIEEHGETLGLLVSAVEDVAKLTDAQIEAPESTRACGIDGSLFRGVARAGGLTVILLDATSILE